MPKSRVLVLLFAALLVLALAGLVSAAENKKKATAAPKKDAGTKASVISKMAELDPEARGGKGEVKFAGVGPGQPLGAGEFLGIIMDDKALSKAFEIFCQARFISENFDFLKMVSINQFDQKVAEYKISEQADRSGLGHFIYNNFIAGSAPRLINVGSTFEPAIKKVDDADAYVGTTFDEVYSEIFRVVVAEPVTQFLRDRTGQAAIDAWQKRMMAEIERVRKARKTMMGLKKGTKKDALEHLAKLAKLEVPDAVAPAAEDDDDDDDDDY